MILTKPQVWRFWSEWRAIVADQHWDKSTAETERRALLLRAGFTSLTQVGRAAGFDRLLAELGLARENVARTIEVGNPDPGYRRRLLWLIKKHGSSLGGVPYILALARDKFHLTAGLSTVEDLTTAQLHQLMITLNARRRKKGHHQAEASYESEEQFPDNIEYPPTAGDEPETEYCAPVLEPADCPF